MRRLSLATPLLVLLVFASTNCRIKKKAAKAAEDDGQLVSMIHVGDPRGSAQLNRGFHGLENQSWRWTMKNFTATLRPPAGAAQKGAGLELKFTIPDVMFNRVGAMTLDARINGIDLGPQTFSSAGDYTYSRDIPATALASDAVAVDFAVDKGLPPGDPDPRELAVIVTSVGLISK
jgi:hypothetical protein